MLITSCFNSANENVIICIFGVGLIGQSIVDKFEKSSLCGFKYLAFNWLDTEAQLRDLECIIDYIRLLPSPDKIEIIWSAGAAGFFSEEQGTLTELHSFERVVFFTNTLVNLLHHAQVNFHLFSSAGGLYEGQIFVTAHSERAPLRHYGRLKLRQEEIIIQSSKNFNYRIYRPSTVYGFLSFGRKGMISAVISSSLRNETIEIFASMYSLRDYVLVSDIANFVYKLVMEGSVGSNDNAIYFLISGKATSLQEIMHKVESITGKKSYVSYSILKRNTLDTTFSPNLKPIDFVSTTLDLGLRRVYSDILRAEFYNYKIS